MLRALGVVLLLACVEAGASEQCSPDTMEACVKQTDPSARLACFDKEMQRRHVVAAAPATPPAAAPVTAAPAAATAAAVTPATAPPATPSAASKPPDENYGLQGPQLQKKLKEQHVERPPPLQPLAATVKRVLPRPDNEYAFELDNGQVWEQAESKSNVNVKPQEAITIVPGAFGSFFLTDGKHLRLRVHRTR